MTLAARGAVLATSGNAVLYQGKTTDRFGGCTLFAGKQVAGAGFCSAWARKA
ncbi:MAG: high-potential iron-sulfur protein [Candidatus Accumulibacter sp.]|uniref:High-potential iron-sulfur protein n=1 Tax=Candidatus Accumulibacter proximus TaxID=2954385 RepID=A0A935PZC2_9PROT|nr:high-potential iron-sulfur protein [Candidatus Accumulibacter proximus]